LNNFIEVEGTKTPDDYMFNEEWMNQKDYAYALLKLK